MSLVLIECLSFLSLVFFYGLGVGVSGVVVFFVFGGRLRYGAIDCRIGLVRVFGVLGRLVLNVGVFRFFVVGLVGLIGRERCSLKVGLV